MIHLNGWYPYQKQLKNRSSKHLHWLVGKENKNILRCVDMETLKRWASVEASGAAAELKRRLDRQDRRADKKGL